VNAADGLAINADPMPRVDNATFGLDLWFQF